MGLCGLFCLVTLCTLVFCAGPDSEKGDRYLMYLNIDIKLIDSQCDIAVLGYVCE